MKERASREFIDGETGERFPKGHEKFSHIRDERMEEFRRHGLIEKVEDDNPDTAPKESDGGTN